MAQSRDVGTLLLHVRAEKSCQGLFDIPHAHRDMAAHAHIARAELVLEPGIDALGRASLVVAGVLGKLVTRDFPGPGFGFQCFLGGRASRVLIDDRHMTQVAGLGADLRRVTSPREPIAIAPASFMPHLSCYRIDRMNFRLPSKVRTRSPLSVGRTGIISGRAICRGRGNPSWIVAAVTVAAEIFCILPSRES